MELIMLAITLIGLVTIGFVMIYGLVDAYKLNKKLKVLQTIENRFVKRDYQLTKEESMELPELYLVIHKGLERRSYLQEKILKDLNGDIKGKDVYDLTEKMAAVESSNMTTCIEFLNKHRSDLMYKCFISAASFVVMLGLMFIILFADKYMNFAAIVAGVLVLCFIFYIRQIALTVPKVKAVKQPKAKQELKVAAK